MACGLSNWDCVAMNQHVSSEEATVSLLWFRADQNRIQGWKIINVLVQLLGRLPVLLHNCDTVTGRI
jgi:hypothetical protein